MTGKKLTKKQKLFTKCLTQAKLALDSISVPFHISDGTALGFYREEAFIEHDPDIDLGVFVEDYKDDIIPAMVKNGFKFIKTYGQVENGQEFTFEFNEKFLNPEVLKQLENQMELKLEQEATEVPVVEIWGEEEGDGKVTQEEEEEVDEGDGKGTQGEVDEEDEISLETEIKVVEPKQESTDSIENQEEKMEKGSVRIDIFLIYKEKDFFWYSAYSYPKKDQLMLKYTPFQVREEMFMGLLVRVPEVKYVNEAYGNWRKIVKDKDFNYMKARNVCKPKFVEHFSGHLFDNEWQKDVTLGIKTFMRPHKLEKCLASVRRFYSDIKVIVADDSKDDFKIQNREICKRFSGVDYLELDWDVGLSAGRNAMVKACQTKYYITMDDDSIVKAETNLKLFYNFLQKKDNFVLIGGKCKTRPSFVCTYSHYSADKTRLYYFNTERGQISGSGGTKALRTDRVMNFFMARTEKLLENLWDEDLKLCEHNNFFIRAWKKKWKIAYTPMVVLFEDMSRGGVYLKYRNRYEKYRSLTWKKTGRLVRLNGAIKKGNRGSVNRGTGNRGTGNRGTGNRGTSNRIDNEGGKPKLKKKSKMSKSRITLRKK